MKLLECILCNGEANIIGNNYSINKIIKCSKCGFTNENTDSPKKNIKDPEVIIIRKRNINE